MSAPRKLMSATVLSLPLQPATYLIDLGVRSGDTSLLDYLGSAFAVEILPGDKTPTFLIQNPNQGVRIPATWSLQND